jgi:hypothetical protein
LSLLAATPVLSFRKDPGSAAPVEQPPQGDRIFLSVIDKGDTADLVGYSSGIRSLLNVRKKMYYGEFVWNDRGVPRGPLTIRVDLTSQIISVFRDGHEIGTAVILYGASEKATPIGAFPVIAKMRRHRSATYDADMPFTLRLTDDGISIHGSDVRWGAATHGCIGVPLDFAEKLFDQAALGDKVAIVASRRRPTQG